MKRRVVIHAGFHKTGTTTLQHTLAQNADFLAPHIEMCLPKNPLLDLLALTSKNFSQMRNRPTRQALRNEAEAFFETFDAHDPRPLLISHENLCGHYPGYKNIRNYSAAGPAMKLISEGFEAALGSLETLSFYFSTRRNGWLASCHWQRLKQKRYKLSLNEFEARYRGADDFDTVLADMRARLGDVAMTSSALEDMGHPVSPILALFGLSHLQSALTIPPNTNVSASSNARAALVDAHKNDLRGPDYWALRRSIFGEDDTEMGTDPSDAFASSSR
ncbi:MAG: hypothetical protein ABF243_04640 [Celeribacter marinus]